MKIITRESAVRAIKNATASQIQRIAKRPNYRHEFVFELLLKRCDELSMESFGEGLEASRALCAFAKSLDLSFEGMALGVLGSALRASGNYGSARSVYVESLALLSEGGVFRGRVLQRFAGLEYAEMKFQEAKERVEESLLYLQGEDEAISLMLKGEILSAQGEYASGVGYVGLALRRLDPRKNTRAYIAAIQSIGKSIVVGGVGSTGIVELSRVIQSVKRRLRGRGSGRYRSMEWVYLDWVEAQIYARLGSHRQAMRQLRRIRERFFEAGGGFYRDAVIVSVDIARVLEDGCAFEEAKAELEGSLSFAKSMQLETEVSILRAYLDKELIHGLEKEIRGLTP